MSHIFLSYSRKDSVFADHLRDLLENEGFGVWMDRTQLMPSKEWEREIERAIRSCGAFLIVVSRNSQDSVPVWREIRLAEKHNKPIFPVWLDGVVWPQLAHLQVDDMRAGVSAPLSPRLAQALRLELGQPEAVRSKRWRRGAVLGAMLVLIPLVALLIAAIAQMWDSGDDEDRGTQPLDSNTLLQTVIAQQSTETAAAYTKTPTPDMTQTFAVLAAEVFAQTATAEATLQAANTQAWIDSWTDTPTPTFTPSITPTPTVTPTPTFTPTPTPIPAGSAAEFGIRDEMTLNGVPFVYVPSGCFMMGSTDFEDASPLHEVCLSAYWIGQTEVTNAQYKRCIDAGGCTAPENDIYDDAQYADHPVVNVDWNQANAYAVWLGETTGTDVSLPTEAQWEYAAAGPEANRYPWGNGDATCELANISGCVGDTSLVGIYPAGASWVGALDMSGNVWKWVADWYGMEYYNTLADGAWNPAGPDMSEDTARVLRGGSWFFDQNYARCVYRLSADPGIRGFSVGFRLVHPSSQ